MHLDDHIITLFLNANMFVAIDFALTNLEMVRIFTGCSNHLSDRLPIQPQVTIINSLYYCY